MPSPQHGDLKIVPFSHKIYNRSTAAEHFIIRMRRDDEGIHAVTPGWFFSMTLLLSGPQFRIRAHIQSTFPF
jgi:hypothetical protein